MTPRRWRAAKDRERQRRPLTPECTAPSSRSRWPRPPVILRGSAKSFLTRAEQALQALGGRAQRGHDPWNAHGGYHTCQIVPGGPCPLRHPPRSILRLASCWPLPSRCGAGRRACCRCWPQFPILAPAGYAIGWPRSWAWRYARCCPGPVVHGDRRVGRRGHRPGNPGRARSQVRQDAEISLWARTQAATS